MEKLVMKESGRWHSCSCETHFNLLSRWSERERVLRYGRRSVYNRNRMLQPPGTEPRTRTQQPLAEEVGAADAGARLRPGLGVWLRDLILSLAISAFIIVFIYQPVKVEAQHDAVARRPGKNLR